MGYTHYWTHAESFTDSEWKQIKRDVLDILRTAVADGLELGDGWGEIRIPYTRAVTDKEIRFNGLLGRGHETFAIGKDSAGWEFCKTAQKPYDVAVTAILAYLEGAHPDKFTASSDGTPEEWKPGIDLLKKALGTRAAFAQPPAEVLEDAQ